MSEKPSSEPVNEGEWRGKDGRRRYDVEPEEFVRAWESSSSAEEAAEKLGMPKPIVHARATKYRDLGIDLKAMPRKGKNKPLMASRLNSVIGEIRKVKGHSEEKGAIDLSDSAVIDKVVERVIARLLSLGIVRLGGHQSPES